MAGQSQGKTYQFFGIAAELMPAEHYKKSIAVVLCFSNHHYARFDSVPAKCSSRYSPECALAGDS